MTGEHTAITGIGSLPGTDVEAATRLVVEACPDVIPYPELPARGPHAGMLGRSLALLDGLEASFEAGEWRLTATAGADLRRARQTWSDDLERFEEASQGREGRVKIAVAGPITLAACVLRPRGGRVLADRGARRDVAQALGEGVAQVRNDWRRRFGDGVMIQCDEPLLGTALAGQVPTEGGYFRHRAVEREDAIDLLRTMAPDLVHSCGPNVPVDLLVGERGVGFDAVALDAGLLSDPDLDLVGAAMERGMTFWCGCLPTAAGGPAPDVDTLTRSVLKLAERLGLSAGRSARFGLTPACGLAGWQPGDVPGAFRVLAAAAHRLDEA